jgi:hypothetical protein
MMVVYRRSFKNTLLVALVASLAGFASGARAAESPLETAYEHVTEAIAALKAAPKNEPLTGSRKKAVELLVRAQSELLKARQRQEPADPAP